LTKSLRKVAAFAGKNPVNPQRIFLLHKSGASDI